VQKFWKLVQIRQSYRQLKGGNIFETQCSLSGRQSIDYRHCIYYRSPME